MITVPHLHQIGRELRFVLNVIINKSCSWSNSGRGKAFVKESFPHQLTFLHLEPAGDAWKTLNQGQRGSLHPQTLRAKKQMHVCTQTASAPQALGTVNCL